MILTKSNRKYLRMKLPSYPILSYSILSSTWKCLQSMPSHHTLTSLSHKTSKPVKHTCDFQTGAANTPGLLHLQGTFVLYHCCVPVYFEILSSTCATECYTAVLFVTWFMFILFAVGPASYTSSALLGSTWCQLYSSSVRSWNLIFYARLCCISMWCHDIHLCALQELYIYVCHAGYFYMMSVVFTYYALSRNLIFYAWQCCIFLRDVIGVHLLWSLGELEILCVSVSFVNDMISSHTPVVARNMHVILMLFIYQHFVQHHCA